MGLGCNGMGWGGWGAWGGHGILGPILGFVVWGVVKKYIREWKLPTSLQNLFIERNNVSRVTSLTSKWSSYNLLVLNHEWEN